MAAPMGPPPLPPAMLPRTSGLAIAGFISAFVCGLVGLILSILGLREINRSNGQLTGRGLAIAGIAISSVGALIAIVGILAAIAIPVFLDYNKKSKKSEAALELDKIMK